MKTLIGVLVTYNRPGQVVRTVKLIAAQDRLIDGLIVVDNSTEPSDAEQRCREVWTRHPAPFLWHRVGYNSGPAGGYEIGMRRALGSCDAHTDSWVMLFDDDDPPPSTTVLSELEDAATEAGATAVGIVGSVLNRRTGLLARPARNDRRFADVDQIGNGRLPIYKLSALLEVGPMRGDLFFGREELELGLRLKSAGHRMVIDQTLRGRYEEVMGKGVRSASAGRVPVRNHLAHRTTLNHLRILRTHLGTAPFLTASLLLLGADLVRVLPAVRSRTAGRALRNLRGTIRAVALAAVRGTLPPVEP